MGLYTSAALAFVITAILTIALRPLALRVHLTDRPGGRKNHVGEIPLVGGIAILIGILVAAQITLETGSHWAFLLPAALLVIVGVVDDRYDTGPVVRLVAQVSIALVMMLGGGLYFRDLGDPFGTGFLELGLIAVPLSLVITLSVINAFNFVDGIDGLAASMALIALSAGAIAAGLTAPATGVAAMACGAILGFLPFNFPTYRNRHLRTFMGDAGSMLLGFTLVWFTITITQGEGRALSPVTALWFALMPLSDFFSCFFRRVARGKVPLHPGREHYHYMLMRAGLSARQVLAVLVAFGVFYAAVGLVGARLKLPDWAIFAPWWVMLALQHFIIKRLAARLRYRRRKASRVVVALPVRVATAETDGAQLDAGRKAA